MKILVPVKRVVDPNVWVRVKPDGSGVDLTNAKMSMNPFDEIAVEEAIRLREAGQASEVVVVTIGPAQAAEVLRVALAMGADRGVQLVSEFATEPLITARLLAALAKDEKPGLILCGKQAIDDDANQTGQMLAALLGQPQGTFASKLLLDDDVARVTREVDGGEEVVELRMPAVVTADLRLKQPRYASLPNIMKARSKPVSVRNAADLGVDMTPLTEILSVEEPQPRQSGVLVDSVDALLDNLKRVGAVA